VSDGLTLEKLKIDDRLREVEVHMAENKTILHQMAETLTSLNLKVGIQNGRVTKLEGWKAWILGGVAMASVIFSASLAIITVIQK